MDNLMDVNIIIIFIENMYVCQDLYVVKGHLILIYEHENCSLYYFYFYLFFETGPHRVDLANLKLTEVCLLLFCLPDDGIKSNWSLSFQ